MSWTASSGPVVTGANLPPNGLVTTTAKATVGNPMVSVATGPTPMVTVVGTAGGGSGSTVTLRFPRRLGTFQLAGPYVFGMGGVDTTATAAYSPAGRPAGVSYKASSGTIVVNSIAANKYSGTFDFFVVDGGNARAVAISQGIFDANQ